MPYLASEPRACTLCSQSVLDQPVVESSCACGAELVACAACTKRYAGRFTASDFSIQSVKVALASNHGCPGGRCTATHHWFRANSVAGDRCACGSKMRNESVRGFVEAS